MLGAWRAVEEPGGADVRFVAALERDQSEYGVGLAFAPPSPIRKVDEVGCGQREGRGGVVLLLEGGADLHDRFELVGLRGRRDGLGI